MPHVPRTGRPAFGPAPRPGRAMILDSSGGQRMGQIEQLLNLLGNTPDEVAAALQAEGVQGVRNTVHTLNPVVRYLATHLRVDAFGLDVMQWDRVRVTLANGKKETRMPEAVRQFLEAFNRGEYPELELPAEKT